MGIVYRNGRPYLYRSVRRDGRVTSEYRGSGELALIGAVLDDEMRDLRQFDRDERKRSDDLERALDDMVKQAQALARDALTAAGYHNHRGMWRKRRVSPHRDCRLRGPGHE
jgi:hypothetical protein